ncbi:MAG TPA: histidinol dehydrogenase [Candidatus Binataceae bacterium]|nr:histidinol dehydrogenase [Candidatus Binataceae bacterium]
MPLRVLDAGSPACERLLKLIFKRRGETGGAVDQAVAKIIAEVRRGGDAALVRLTARFDTVRIPRAHLRVSAAELADARATLPVSERRALELAARRIEAFHRRTLIKSFSYREALGMRLGSIVRPLRRVGIYVPGGQGAYPSSVLMNAIPARVAGVKEIAMVSPPGKSADKPAKKSDNQFGDNLGVLAAAAIAGVSEVYRVGGAQAIAALAYGTATIAPVDKIVGPGNAWVQAAKRMVNGAVDIDKMAGPSEVLIIADAAAHPTWVAADLIAQAEHGSGDEAAILLTNSRSIAEETAAALERALDDLPRAAAVRRVMARRAAAIIVKDLDAAFELANQIAPEHLELEIANPARWLPRVEAAGAVFLGGHSPAPLGDYLAGPNHVLPTGGAARFASPLGAYDFLKRTSIIESSQRALAQLAPATTRLARMEGFEGHARAIEVRFEQGQLKLNGRQARRGNKASNGKSS